jgi:hypothetical protein
MNKFVLWFAIGVAGVTLAAAAIVQSLYSNLGGVRSVAEEVQGGNFEGNLSNRVLECYGPITDEISYDRLRACGVGVPAPGDIAQMCLTLHVGPDVVPVGFDKVIVYLERCGVVKVTLVLEGGTWHVDTIAMSK